MARIVDDQSVSSAADGERGKLGPGVQQLADAGGRRSELKEIAQGKDRYSEVLRQLETVKTISDTEPEFFPNRSGDSFGLCFEPVSQLVPHARCLMSAPYAVRIMSSRAFASSG